MTNAIDGWAALWADGAMHILRTFSHWSGRDCLRFFMECASLADTSRLISVTPHPASRSVSARSTARTLAQVAL